MKHRRLAAVTAIFLLVAAAAISLAAQSLRSRDPDWLRIETETLTHFQSILRIDTSNPPGNETGVVDYLKDVLLREGIPVQTFAVEPRRANLVARLKGNGSKRPLLIMGHTDVVTVDPQKWTFPPFSATRDGGYVYGRGSLDDKPSVVADLMVMLSLKRLNVPLDRDVIFLAEAGEEGATRVGIDFMTAQHFSEIDAEYCLAEGGGAEREAGRLRFASVGTLEKVQRTIELIARGPSAHGSVPIASNAVGKLAAAVTAVNNWRSPIRLNETTRAYFTRLVDVSTREDAARFRAVLGTDTAAIEQTAKYFEEHSPSYAAVLRTTVSPTILRAGLRYNVIPSEAIATLDVRMLPDDDPAQLIPTIQKVINDPSVEVRFAQRDGQQRPPGSSSIDTEAFRAIERVVARHYDTATIPTMGNGASDKAQMRAKGVQCYGIGPAGDTEDHLKGFGAHSDQERILERDLHTFVHFTWDVVVSLARSAQ
jgi:acetylornithine deacetylase/succinyl-diaminopimelate desuccinylase-like protein